MEQLKDGDIVYLVKDMTKGTQCFAVADTMANAEKEAKSAARDEPGKVFCVFQPIKAFGADKPKAKSVPMPGEQEEE